MENKEYYNQIKKDLDEVSPSFCVAKWKQVTMHLQNGQTHSCHHPRTHFVPVEEIKKNPTALHNSEYKKQQRKLMLEGVRPSECEYCWKVEDTPGEHFSDRVYKSGDQSWATPYMGEILANPWDYNADPSYVEVSFGNVCNFKCSYCAPHISSQWMEEIERHGPYQLSHEFNNLDWLKMQNQMPIPNNQENPYVDAFWEWFPSMYKSLKYFRITGGEPLLNKNTFKVLDYIIANPNRHLEVAINTNMNPPPEIFDRFLEKLKIIIDQNKVKKIKLFTSAEAHGKQSEYIRYGMNYSEWLKNIHIAYERIPNLEFTIMSTFNLLSIPSYTKFLQDMLDIKKQYLVHPITKVKRSPLIVDIPYLRYPYHQSSFLCDSEHLEMVKESVDFMYNNLESPDSSKTAFNGFFRFEADKLQRIYDMLKVEVEKEVDIEKHKNRQDFVIFVDEHDRRRGTNFLETFPEFTDFYEKNK